MNFQRRVLSTGEAVGDPGPLPANIANLALADLADLPAALGDVCCGELDYTDTGFLPFTPDPPVAAMRAELIAAIKAEAGRRILEIMPEWKQRNSLARGMAMVTLNGASPLTWPEADQVEYAVVMLKWGQISAIRTASDAIEADVPAATVENAEALTDFAVEDHPLWP